MIDIIALVAVGFATWGLVLTVFRLALRRKPPRWASPLAIGLAMIGFAVWNDYSWPSRTAEALPPRAVVVDEVSAAVAWQPWTLLVPRVEALVVVDRARVRHNDRLPGHALVEIALVRRYGETLVANHLFDCSGRRRTVIGADAAVDARGMPTAAAWEPVPAGSPVASIACGS